MCIAAVELYENCQHITLWYQRKDRCSCTRKLRSATFHRAAGPCWRCEASLTPADRLLHPRSDPTADMAKIASIDYALMAKLVRTGLSLTGVVKEWQLFAEPMAVQCAMSGNIVTNPSMSRSELATSLAINRENRSGREAKSSAHKQSPRSETTNEPIVAIQTTPKIPLTIVTSGNDVTTRTQAETSGDAGKVSTITQDMFLRLETKLNELQEKQKVLSAQPRVDAPSGVVGSGSKEESLAITAKLIREYNPNIQEDSEWVRVASPSQTATSSQDHADDWIDVDGKENSDDVPSPIQTTSGPIQIASSSDSSLFSNAAATISGWSFLRRG